MAVGRSGFSTPSAQPFRPAAETQRISAVQAEDRRHVRDLLVDRETTNAPAFGTELVSQADIATSFNPPRGDMMLSFLAQHIAQEVSPEIAGPDRHGSATNAYIGARDFNIEMLPEGAGVDIRI
jgi:hypothetical protein